jgi:hypothetical protein
MGGVQAPATHPTTGDSRHVRRRGGSTGGMMEGRKPQPSSRPLATHEAAAWRQHWRDDGGAQASAKLPTTGDKRYGGDGSAGDLRSSSVAREGEGEVLSDIVSSGPKPLPRSYPA